MAYEPLATTLLTRLRRAVHDGDPHDVNDHVGARQSLLSVNHDDLGAGRMFSDHYDHDHYDHCDHYDDDHGSANFIDHSAGHHDNDNAADVDHDHAANDYDDDDTADVDDHHHDDSQEDGDRVARARQ